MKQTDIATLVKNDIEARAQLGEKKYGERLKANNGRRGIQDAYEECLDQSMYLRQIIEEGFDTIMHKNNTEYRKLLSDIVAAHDNEHVLNLVGFINYARVLVGKQH